MSYPSPLATLSEKKLWKIALEQETIPLTLSQLYLLHDMSSIEDICLLTGLTVKTAQRVQAFLEIHRRLCQHQATYPTALNSPTAAYRYLHTLGSQDQEMIRVLYLDSQLRLLQDKVVAIGSVNAAHVGLKDLFRPGFIANAHTFILAHNHPHGDLLASESDIEFTKYLAHTGQAFGMPLQDHLIITKVGFVSLRQKQPELFL